MKTTNAQFDNCRYLWIFNCALFVVFFVCKTVCGQSIIEELDPTSLLTADSGQNEEKITLPDIKMPPLAREAVFDNPEPTANQATSFAAAVKDQLPQTSPPPADTPARQVERQLRKSNISPLTQHSDNGKADDLKQIIEQIRSIEFGLARGELVEPATVSQVKPQQPAVSEDGKQNTEDREQKTEDRGQRTEDGKQKIEYQSSVLSQPSSEIQMLEDLLKDPNRIANPLELAEVLFKSGKPSPAGLCYKQALISLDANDTNMAGERAWILFQIGNCFKYDDPNTARQSFAELIRTHPSSPWAEIAKSEHGIVEWYQQDQPRKLIQEINQ
jgi:hypothetical protein